MEWGPIVPAIAALGQKHRPQDPKGTFGPTGKAHRHVTSPRRRYSLDRESRGLRALGRVSLTGAHGQKGSARIFRRLGILAARYPLQILIAWVVLLAAVMVTLPKLGDVVSSS